MLIMAGMNRQTRQASGRAQSNAKPVANKAAERKDAAPRLPLGEEIITRPTFRRERAALKRGVWPIAGCDEAGRGPLAGPVVAAAVILDPDNIPRGLDDSKRLTPERRAVLYDRICERAQVAVALAPPARIDRDNILRASLWALARAVAALPVKPALVFVDGRDRIAAGCDCQAVIGGDGLVASIAAASIVAKVERDRMIAAWDPVFPVYGLASNKGYSAPKHLQALREHGPSPLHRQSFAPVWTSAAPQQALEFMLHEDSEIGDPEAISLDPSVGTGAD